MDEKNVSLALNNKQENLVPFSVWHHFTENEHIDVNKNHKAFETDISGENKYVKEVNPDFIKLMNDGFFTYHYKNVDNPNDIESLAQIKEIDDNDDWLKRQFSLIKKDLEQLDNRKNIFYSAFSPVTLLKWTLMNFETEESTAGDQRLVNLYLKDSKVVSNALNVITQDIKKQIKVAYNAGIDGIFFSTQQIQDSRINAKDFFNNIQKNLDEEVIDTINYYFNKSILHVCGFDGATNNLSWFKDYNLPIINWSTNVDGYTLGQGKQLFNGKVVLGGFGITNKDVLFSGNKQEIQNVVDRILDESGTKGVMLGADCTIPRDTPVQNIKWASEAAHTYNERKEMR